MKYAIIFGGQSYEHEISIVSAIVMKKVLKVELSFIFVSDDRNFYEISSQNMQASFFSSKKYKKSPRLILTYGGFAKHGIFGLKKLDVDCYINLIHGADGEDGKIAGLFEFYSLKFIGPRLEASVLSFNKIYTKKLCELCGVKSLNYEVIKKSNDISITYPVILKPARLGSSIGVQIVKDASELDYAKDVAFEFDSEVLVEPFIENIKEYNLAGFKADDKFYFSLIEEPKKQKFLDFEQKYLSFSNSDNVNEANISQDTKNALQDAFMRIYNTGHFDGALIRCDFFVYDNNIYLNEINPNPGSLANYLFKDFTNSLNTLANSLTKAKEIQIQYSFISQINGQKGKIS